MNAIETRGVEHRYVSRLLHYWYRAKRCLATEENDKKVRRELIRRIEEGMKQHKIGPPASAVIERINDMLNDADKSGVQGNNTPNSLRDTGTIPKAPKHSSTAKGLDLNNETQQKIDHLERMVESMSKLLTERESHVTQERKRSDDRVVKKVRRSGLFSSNYSSSSEGLDKGEGRPSNRHFATALRQRERTVSDSMDSTISDSEGGSERHPRPARDRGHRHDHGTRDHLNRVEKWKIRFTGDSRSISVENFLYKLKKIAEREDISKRQLLRDIHLLLDGPASDWFFTFVDEFDDWLTFERLIKYRFGNPNQDQGIRQRIQDRKQQRGESFIAFVTEIEKLNRMLSKPLSSTRKFEVIWDNMRQHYRSKISIVDVRNLQQLVKLNHRIDAADPNLHQIGEPRRTVNNVEVDQSDYDSDESVSVNAMKSRPTRENRASTTPNQTHNQQIQRTNQPPFSNGEQSAQRACWNCQQLGHGWRECARPKVIFCYGCGNLGRTIRCCERCSAVNRSTANQGN